MRFLFLMFAVTIIGCGGDEPGSVVLETRHTVNGATLVLLDLRYQNAAGQTYGVDDLQYYLSDVVLHRSDGAVYVADRALYNDAEVPETLQHRLENVPPGRYLSISFTWGLDEEKNVPAGLPDNPQNNNMVWPEPLGGGYHYSKCNGFYLDALGARAGYATHTGRVRRAGIDTEDHHHFFTVTLPLSLTVDGNSWTLPIVMDINQWYEGPNVYDFPTASMIMNDLDRQNVLMENGPSAFSIGTISER